MNKYLRRLLCFIFGVALYCLLPIGKVEAATNFAYLQCNYKTTYISKYIDELYKNQNFDVNLLYSDYEMSAGIGINQTYGPLGLYRIYNDSFNNNTLTIGPTKFLGNAHASASYGVVGLYAELNNYWGDSDDPLIDTRAEMAFQDAISESGSCPKYFYLKKRVSNGTDYVDAYFTNTRPDSCSQSDDSNRPCFVMLSGTTVVSKLIDNEKYWTFKSSCPSAKIGADISIFSSGNVLKYSSKNNNSSDFLSTEDVSGGYVHDLDILGVYNLENGISQSISYNPRESDSKKSWSDGLCFSIDGYPSCGNTYCNTVVAPAYNYNCPLFDEIKQELTEKYNLSLISYNKMITIRNAYLKLVDPSHNIYIANTYENISNAAELKKIYTALETAKNDDNFKNEQEIFENYLDGIEICTSEKSKITDYYNLISNNSKAYADITANISDSLENIAKRALELNDSQLVKDANALAQEYDEASQSAYAFYERVKQNLLDMLDLNLSGLSSSGCDIISYDMKKFLNTVLWYIRIAGIVLTIILSLLDYIKAATGSDDKSMAAANKKFVTRVVLVAVLFLVPVLLDFLLSVLNISTTAGSISCLD